MTKGRVTFARSAVASRFRRGSAAIGGGYRCVVAKFTTFIRSVGLGIATITKGQESAKILVIKSRRVALSRCGVHILPSMVSVILITFNLLGYFIGTQLQGPQGQDAIKLGVLQVCAKAQELLVVASLSMVVFHVLRHELIFGAGLPLGLVGAGFSFTSLGYFWSSDFWGAVNYKHPSPVRKTLILMLLIVSGILAVLAGPTSAVLMIPREMDWKTGGGIFWLNGSKEEMWPSTLDDTMLPTNDCSGSNWLDDPSCIANGYQSIYLHFENWKMNAPNGTTSFELQDRHLRKNVYARARPPLNIPVETWVYTSYAPVGIMQSAVYALWTLALGYLADNRPWMHPQPKLLSWSSARTVSVNTDVPAARVVCSDELKAVPNLSSVFLYFPAIPEYRNRYWQAGDDVLQLFQGIDVTQSVQERAMNPINFTSLGENAVMAASVDLAPGANQSSSIGVVLMRPASENTSSNASWVMQPCSIDPRWAAGTSTLQENSRDIRYDFEADQGRALVESELDDAVYGWGWFVPPDDGTWRRVQVADTWFKSLSPMLPTVDGSFESDTANQTALDSILTKAARGVLGDPLNTSMMEFALATIMVDSLSRSTSYRASNYSAMLDEVVSAPWSVSLARSFIRVGEPKEAFHPPDADQLYRVKMHVILHGYVIAAVGWFDYFCIAILLLHAVIAIGHTVWIVFGSAKTSDAWDSLTELLALGLNSEQPNANGDDAMTNASTGIRTWEPLKQVGWVEAVDGNGMAQATGANTGKKNIQLRFGNSRHFDNGQKDGNFAVDTGVEYGVDRSQP